MDITNLYLVAHLAAGEPKLDIAEKLTCHLCAGEGCEPQGFCGGHGYWWQLVGGWRCWPYWVVPLAEVIEGVPLPIPPSDAVDTWWSEGRTGIEEVSKVDLVAKLGLSKPKEDFIRRI